MIFDRIGGVVRLGHEMVLSFIFTPHRKPQNALYGLLRACADKPQVHSVKPLRINPERIQLIVERAEQNLHLSDGKGCQKSDKADFSEI